MSFRSIDLETMFKEIETINNKYGVPKGIWFVPDKLEIILERKEEGKFNLIYSEFFNYLPQHVLSIAVETTVQLLQHMGFPSENVIRIENGVKVQMSGDFKIPYSTIAELLIQNKYDETKIRANFESIIKHYQILSHLSDFHWSWNDETERKLNNFLSIWNKVIQENPSVSSEIEAVIKRYTTENH